MDRFYSADADPEDTEEIVESSCAEGMLHGRVLVFDTTLRDGEQAAGSRLDPSEKLRIATQLAKLGVDAIEAGFPASSPKEFESVRLLSQRLVGPVVCALSRAIPGDIQICGQALQNAEHPRIHTGLGVSDIHIQGKFRDPRYGRDLTEKRETVLRMALESVRLAKSLVDDVEFYAEDTFRADPGYLAQVIGTVINAGATIINIPDTTGYAQPGQISGLIKNLMKHVPELSGVVLSVHCHNDLGLAVANTLTGLRAGARQAECTILGIGERAGNASLEEVVMAVKTRKDYYGLETVVNTQEIYRTCQMVARAFGFQVPRNKAIVGLNAFAHSAGIHVDGFLKDRKTYEIIKPQDVGVPGSRIVLTARSGRHAVRHRLEQLGYVLSRDQVDTIYARFLEVADRVRQVSDQALLSLLNGQAQARHTIQLQELSFWGATNRTAHARARITIGGRTVEAEGVGDGPVDASYAAMAQATKMQVDLEDFSLVTTGKGSEAIGEATVRISRHGTTTATGRGASTDIVQASALAYLDALNEMMQAEHNDDRAARQKPSNADPPRLGGG